MVDQQQLFLQALLVALIIHGMFLKIRVDHIEEVLGEWQGKGRRGGIDRFRKVFQRSAYGERSQDGDARALLP